MRRAILAVAAAVMVGCGGSDWRGNEVSFGLDAAGHPYCHGMTRWGGSLAPDSTWYDCQWLCGFYGETPRTYVHVSFVRSTDSSPDAGWQVHAVDTVGAAECPVD